MFNKKENVLNRRLSKNRVYLEQIESEWRQCTNKTRKDRLFNILYPNYRRCVLGYVIKNHKGSLDFDQINDIVSIVFEKFIKHQKSIINNFSNIKILTWLIATAKTTVIDEIRKLNTAAQKNIIKTDLFLNSGNMTKEGVEQINYINKDAKLNLYSITEDSIEFKMFYGKFLEEVNQLPENIKPFFIKKNFLGMQYKEIALQHNCTDNVIKSKVFIAKNIIRDKLQNDYTAMVDCYNQNLYFDIFA